MYRGRRKYHASVRYYRNEYDKLLKVCKDICLNYAALKEEINEIYNVLSMAETYAAAYLKESFMRLHMNEEKPKLDITLFKKLVSDLEQIKKGSKDEFMQHIDFTNILKEIFSNKDRGDIITYVWRAKVVLDSIEFQLSRIKDNDNNIKKVAILKGMIAYY